MEMIIDAHVHLFHPKVIQNIKKRKEMVRLLKLGTEGAEERTGVSFLENELKNAGIKKALILPTSKVNDVKNTNDSFFNTAGCSNLLFSAGTLHPHYKGIRQELERFMTRNIRGIKLCSFSQGFSLNDPATFNMLDLILEFNTKHNAGFFIILDSFFRADQFLGIPEEYITSPALFADIVKHFPKINFIAAHMGGLTAPFDQIKAHMVPMDNLYMDTSNAAHVLAENEYIFLLKTHGPEHIIFGTDWPWFTHKEELALQKNMTKKTGFSTKDQALVFGKNIIRLMGKIPEPLTTKVIARRLG
jgi:uncharacterized protein